MAYENFIGGAWKPAASGATDEVLDPATGEVIAEVPSSDANDVDAAVAAATEAFASWGRTTPRERSEKLLALADAVEENLDELKTLEMRNVGKPVSIIDFEFDLTVDNLRFFAGAARSWRPRRPASTSRTTRRCCGATRSACAPASHRGTTRSTWRRGSSGRPWPPATRSSSSRPSSRRSPRCKLAELAADIFPPGVFNVVCGQGETAGDALVRHPGVAMVSLTGDVATGKLIARNAADTLKRVHLELGGKAPVIVFDDADLDAGRRHPGRERRTTTRARTAPPRAGWSPVPASTTTSSAA